MRPNIGQRQRDDGFDCPAGSHISPGRFCLISFELAAVHPAQGNIIEYQTTEGLHAEHSRVSKPEPFVCVARRVRITADHRRRHGLCGQRPKAKPLIGGSQHCVFRGRYPGCGTCAAFVRRAEVRIMERKLRPAVSAPLLVLAVRQLAHPQAKPMDWHARLLYVRSRGGWSL